ncbi:MATE family efflux transporter [Halobaculum sp. MBLA0143]|uniref:MATE family efflux transporter n=1 Tax=Halobaculum sp. MBLA0143 TaxID=3079933 RepID=UPI0035252017
MSYFDVSREEITEGSIPKAILLIATPLFAQNLVLTANQIVDLFWLGQFNALAVAAVGLASPLVWLLIGICIDVPFAGTRILFAQRYGSEDEMGAKRVAFNGLLVAVALGLLLGQPVRFLAGAAAPLLAELQPQSGGTAVAEMATAYIQIVATWIFLAGLGDVAEGCLLARGNSRATLVINVLVVVANLTVDPLLIFGVGPLPQLGIRGAAYATVASYLAGFVVAGVLAVRDGDVYSLATAKPRWNELREILDIGSPKVVSSTVGNAVSMAVFFVVFTVGGAAGLTAYTVGTRVSAVALLPVGAVGSAVSTVTGQNIGATEATRAKAAVYSGLKISVAGMLLLGGVQFLAASTVTKLFVPTIGERELALSVTFVELLALSYPASGVLKVVSSGFNAARRTRTSMMFRMANKLVLRLPLAVILGVMLSYETVGVFWARVGSSVTIAALFLTYILYEMSQGMYTSAVKKHAG